MIETSTVWSETSYDCPHCGGIIMKRIDQEAGQPDYVCHQCGQCGCQWSLTGELLRVGNGPHCHLAAAQSADPIDMGEVWGKLPSLPANAWVYAVAALLAFLILARFGLVAMALRLVIPLLLFAFVIWLVWLAVRSSQRA
jgi:predicted RNA-binding Zn-ribbon protein involved in translation (DUF1610 family)